MFSHHSLFRTGREQSCWGVLETVWHIPPCPQAKGRRTVASVYHVSLHHNWNRQHHHWFLSCLFACPACAKTVSPHHGSLHPGRQMLEDYRYHSNSFISLEDGKSHLPPSSLHDTITIQGIRPHRLLLLNYLLGEWKFPVRVEELIVPWEMLTCTALTVRQPEKCCPVDIFPWCSQSRAARANSAWRERGGWRRV